MAQKPRQTRQTKPKSQKRQTAQKLIALALSFVLVAMSSFAFTACAGTAPEEEPVNSGAAEVEATPVELQIFAANSLEKVLPEVQALYTEQNPHVTFADTQFKGSGDLVTSLAGGASADLLITASSGTMDDAVSNGSVDEGTRNDLFYNDLIIIKQEGSDLEITRLEDVTNETITKIALGEADAVPAGAYANQSLYTIGLYTDESGKGGTYTEGFADKVVTQAKVGDVCAVVSTGDAQIGFVYSSDLYRYDGIEEAFTVPGNTHKNIVYPGAVVAGSAHAEEAQKFLDFCMNDPEALALFTAYGFEIA